MCFSIRVVRCECEAKGEADVHSDDLNLSSTPLRLLLRLVPKSSSGGDSQRFVSAVSVVPMHYTQRGSALEIHFGRSNCL